jgi:D-alanyl-D-alanine carboxypeptidase/D-alanyl-D-alanine-endopeptidase (penicillin-binding protein 4)
LRPRSVAFFGALLIFLVVRLGVPGDGALASIPDEFPGTSEPRVPSGFFSIAESAAGPALVAADRAADLGIAADPREAPAQVETIGAPGGSALQADLESLVGKWYQTAKQKSKGKLDGDGTQISVHVRDLLSGVTLASIQGDRILRPASTLKVATSAAGLALLGGTGEYRTLFEAAGPIQNGVLDGDLIVHAGGDPLVRNESNGAVESRLDEVARGLLDAGVSRISGSVVLNEGSFLEPGIGPAWPSSNQHWDDYCSLAAGLTINAGVLVAEVTARGVGAKATIAVHPSPHGLKNNYGVSGVKGSVNDVRVGATSTTVTVKGKLGTKAGAVVSDFSHPDPVGMFGSVLLDRLERGGVSVAGGFVRRRGPPVGPNKQPLFILRSPIADSLVPINTHSENGVADQLFFTLGDRFGGGGTRAGGAKAIKLAFETLGIDPKGHIQVDGSGLSRDNRISPIQLTGLLRGVLVGLLESDPLSQRFLDSLAVAGEDGTLATRMRGTEAQGSVFGKTGFIDGTSALSGLAVTTEGRGIIFSIIVNYPTLGGLNNSAWKPMQDAMVLRIFGS